MKKSKIIAIISMALCVLMLFTSCGVGGFLDYMDDESEEAKIIKSSVKVEGFSVDFYEVIGDLFLSYKGLPRTYTVYNGVENKVVYTVADSETTIHTVSLKRIDDISFFTVSTKVDGVVTKTELFSASGKSVASVNADAEYERADDIFKFGNAVYGFDKKGNIKKLKDIDGFTDISADWYSEDYAYTFLTDGIKICDRYGKFVSGYQFKEQYNLETSGVLADGTVCVQYTSTLPDDAKKFDYFDAGKKIDLITELINPKNGKVKNVDVEFLIDEIGSCNDVDGFEDCDLNCAEVALIVDQKLAKGTVILVNDALDIKTTVDDTIDGAVKIRNIGDKRFVVSDIYGNSHFIYKGKIYKTVPANDVKYNEKYIYTDDAVYDFDFKKVYDLKANKFTIDSKGDISLLLKKNTAVGKEYAIYTNDGRVVNLATDTDTLTYNVSFKYIGLYEVFNGTDYTYYNENGERIATFTSAISINPPCSDGTVIVTVGSDIYRFNTK